MKSRNHHARNDHFDDFLIRENKSDRISPARGKLPSQNEELFLENGLSKEFFEYARANKWKDRQNNGFRYREDVFHFIREVYRDWLDGSIKQSDILSADESLWWAIQNRLRKDTLPDDINLPKEDDYILDNLKSPEDRDLLLKSREWNRRRMKSARTQSPRK